MKMTAVKCALALVLFSCQSDDIVDPAGQMCKQVEMKITDPDDPIDLVIDYDETGRVTVLRGSGGDGQKLDLKLKYDSDGLIENDLSGDYEIDMDAVTKKVTHFELGDINAGPALSLFFNDDRITLSHVVNGDNEGIRTVEYTYDNDGNATTVKASLEDENGDELGSYFVEFTYDKTHLAVFANAPFLQAYTTLSAYLLPFGLTNKNVVSHMTITFSYNDDVAVESRDINYTYNDQGKVTSIVWSNKGGSYETVFNYDCN